MEPAYRYRALCHRVIDGDTYELDIDLGFKTHAVVPVRLRGWNAPEMNTPEGLLARDAAFELLHDAGEFDVAPVPLIITSYKGQQTFARWVCDIWLLKTGELLGEVLGARGHVVPFR